MLIEAALFPRNFTSFVIPFFYGSGPLRKKVIYCSYGSGSPGDHCHGLAQRGTREGVSVSSAAMRQKLHFSLETKFGCGRGERMIDR
jgi:hypothetical protein